MLCADELYTFEDKHRIWRSQSRVYRHSWCGGFGMEGAWKEYCSKIPGWGGIGLPNPRVPYDLARKSTERAVFSDVSSAERTQLPVILRSVPEYVCGLYAFLKLNWAIARYSKRVASSHR